MGGYSGTKEEINQKQRDYYTRNRDKMIGKNNLWKQNHPEQVKSWRRERYLRNRDKEIREQCERNLIESFIERDCCVFCLEINPFVLEQHHPFENNSFKVTLCSKCHSLIHFSTSKRTPDILEFMIN